MRLIGITIALCICLTTTLHGQQSVRDRLSLLDAEIYGIDRSHSTLKFSIGFLGLTDVEGTFDRYTATIFYNEEDMSRTSVVLRVQTTSVNTGNETRDEDLRSERFLDAESHPEIVFKSSAIKPVDGGYLMEGNLTIKGITKQISIPVQHPLKRTADQVWGNIRIGFTGEVTFDRYDFNVDGGGFWGATTLSREVTVRFSILGNKFNLDKFAYHMQEKPSIGSVVEETLEQEGVEAAVARYRELEETAADEYDFREYEINLLVNRLVQRRQLDLALPLCKLYVEMFPESTNSWSTLGVIYAGNGNRAKAIEAFRKARSLDGGNDEAAMALRRLESE